MWLGFDVGGDIGFDVGLVDVAGTNG